MSKNMKNHKNQCDIYMSDDFHFFSSTNSLLIQTNYTFKERYDHVDFRTEIVTAISIPENSYEG